VNDFELFEVEQDFELEDLLDRATVVEICKSVFTLFGIPIRVVSQGGTVYGELRLEYDLCSFVNTASAGRQRCGQTIDGVKNARASDSEQHACFTGLVYDILPIHYETRVFGRVIIGPYAPAQLAELPAEGKVLLQTLDAQKLTQALAKVPHAKTDTTKRIAKHILGVFDLVLFNAHKAALTSKTHLASVNANFRELTEKTEKLQETYDRLKELDRLKSNFLATVSHELKTPLTSILGYSEMLAEGFAGPLTDPQKDYVKTIFEKGEHLLGMITSLLDLSKLEIGTMGLKREHGKIFPMLHAVYTTLVPLAKKKGVNLNFECKAEAFETRFDALRLRQVFTNIAENAIKFTEPGGTVTIRDEIESGDGSSMFGPSADTLRVLISDTGMGIPESQRSRVFDAFYQVDSSSTREFGGTGLGLAIAKRITDAHEGTIEIQANTPNGTIFVVRLPSAHAVKMGGRPTVPAFAIPDLEDYKG
jgi:two-component system, NarL family, sensor histidine kinase BarA